MDYLQRVNHLKQSIFCYIVKFCNSIPGSRQGFIFLTWLLLPLTKQYPQVWHAKSRNTRHSYTGCTSQVWNPGSSLQVKNHKTYSNWFWTLIIYPCYGYWVSYITYMDSGDQDSVLPLTGTRTLVNGLAKELGLNKTVPYSAWFEGRQVSEHFVP